MCYIDAMIVKGLAIFAMLVTMTPVLLGAQANSPAAPPAAHPATQPKSTLPQHPATVPRSALPAPARPDLNGAPSEDQQPHVIVTLPAPAPTVWPVHDRILWGAYLVLAILGYVGIMLAVSTLKKIERHTSAAEAAATAATNTAQAALLHAQTIVNAERPWVLITAEPTRGVESSFDITATNRGRSPATITSAVDKVIFAADEARLSGLPQLKPAESGARFVPVILLPGESATLKTFSREDVKGICETDERFANVESWKEKLFLCGKVAYQDLIAPADKQAHETNWCCWYIHGKQRSALVPAGPAEYNAHT